ncbi:MAG: PAS domain-containing protein [Methylobacterium mesophilicum]|nr:PAS domain-containing protein [Methylobacterium mesophilicum]
MKADDAWKDIPRPTQADLFQGDGTAARVRSFDWSATPLGPIDRWAPWLRSTVDTLLASGLPSALWVGPHLTTIHNDAFRPIMGGRADRALGVPLEEVWPDVWDDILPMVRKALSGETVVMTDLPLLMTRNGVEEQTNWLFTYLPVRDGDGVVQGFLDTAVETTEAVRARALLELANTSLVDELTEQREVEKRQRVVQRELSHRMKNSLAMVQAIVQQSLRNATSLAAAQAAIGARIGTLSRAQDVLTKTSWKQADAGELIALALEPHRDGDNRFRLHGPATRLGPQQALGLALAIHELATNAAKHGALSNETGHVDVGWSSDADRFRLEWREEGGPPVQSYDNRGFGSRLLERIVPGYFEGEGAVEQNPKGIVYVLTGFSGTEAS